MNLKKHKGGRKMKVKWFRYIVLLGGLAVIGMTGMISPQLVLSDDRPDMVVAVQKLPPNLEPMADNSNVHARIIRNLGDRLLLIDYKDNFKIIPNLAESWKRIDDRTIEFKLRKGVKFHDGNELTAEDVAFSFGNDRLFHEERGLTTTKPFLGNIEVPKVIDDYTVRIRSKQPDPLLEKRVAIYKSEIVSRKAFEKVGDWQKWTLQTVASGPYKLVEFKTGDYIKLVAHDDYWGPKAPAKSITFKAVPEVAARIAGLKTGEFHIITEIPPDQLKSIEAAEDCAAVGGPIPNIRSVNFDTTNPILIRTMFLSTQPLLPFRLRLQHRVHFFD
jgi:peptide/nickel transport system substrate-binding protein